LFGRLSHQAVAIAKTAPSTASVGALRRGDRSNSMGSPQENAAAQLAQAQGDVIFS
jgi:hypothetical protein